MIARLSRYRVPVQAVAPLVDEVVSLARARSPSPAAHAEFFFVDSAGGEGLSVLLADDESATPAIALPRPPSDVQDYSVHLLQLGGPRRSGVVETLLGRIVWCDPEHLRDLSFNGDAVPASAAVWARTILVMPGREVLALAVATEQAPLEESLDKFAAAARSVHDYDDVAYHFLGRT